jgi:hypothetical protein
LRLAFALQILIFQHFLPKTFLIYEFEQPFAKEIRVLNFQIQDTKTPHTSRLAKYVVDTDGVLANISVTAYAWSE